LAKKTFYVALSLMSTLSLRKQESFWASSVRTNSLGRQPLEQATVQSCKPDCFGIVKRETHFTVKGPCFQPPQIPERPHGYSAS
jgi:hypothetical protein